MVDQVGAIDPSRLSASVGVVSWDAMAEVDRALQLVLGLSR
jgi:mRNA-degrading endonuclease toxin of MazEF toxin-antitoxin module